MEWIHGTIPILILVGVIATGLFKALIEVVEAIVALKNFIHKYKKLFTKGEEKKDYDNMIKKMDTALESIADFVQKFQLRKTATKLRNIIKLES